MFESLVKKILKKEKVTGRIDVTLVSKAKIRELNKKYRKIDKPTDVLSFAYLPVRQASLPASRQAARRGAEEILGDVVISEKDRRLVIHGVLHILGYKHGKKMSHAEEIYQKL